MLETQCFTTERGQNRKDNLPTTPTAFSGNSVSPPNTNPSLLRPFQNIEPPLITGIPALLASIADVVLAPDSHRNRVVRISYCLNSRLVTWMLIQYE